MGEDGGAAAWVEDTCSSLSTAELFVQPDMGDGRFAEASSVLGTLLGWGFERSWPDDSQVVQDELQPYYEKVLGLVLPSLVVAGLLLLCLLPLWVSRCLTLPLPLTLTLTLTLALALTLSLTLALALALSLAQVGRALLRAPLLRADAPVVQQQPQAARVRLLQPLGRGRARVRRRWTAQQRAGR